jgi:protein Tex
MTDSIPLLVAAELGLSTTQISSVQSMLAEGCTVPFIARYRKERTGSLDEVAIMRVRDRLKQLEELATRKEAILKSLEERKILTEPLRIAIDAAGTMIALEDIYLPYRPKRRTRATIAREKGLEPLAVLLLGQTSTTDPVREAQAFVNPEKGVTSVEEALAGARDILAEIFSENAVIRGSLRSLFEREGVLRSTLVNGKEEEATKYRDYFQFEEPVSRTPGHRLLAAFRGESEGFLRISICPPEEKALAMLSRHVLKGESLASSQITDALKDGYQRLLAPSIENDVRRDFKARADAEAIRVFALNLRELLMAPPLGSKTTLAVDPGFRTGCKVVCLDRQGRLLFNTTVYPTLSSRQAEEAAKTISEIVSKFGVEAIAIGNGTAGRETEAFIRTLGLPGSIPMVLVNESGASIYSASEAAREEFPDCDLTVRGAVSIGRRLMDPLAELVKIDPKSIGVGQYQYDVDQGKLKQGLDDEVMTCVNKVGVELNTASQQILAYVSGIGAALSKNIFEYRNQNGAFRSRKELKKVPRLGPKAFEQAAGFLRIRDAEDPLDSSAIHPENYGLVRKMAEDLGTSVRELMNDAGLRQKIPLHAYVSSNVGMQTLSDILEELGRPGRDPREHFAEFRFAPGITSIEQIKPGMRLPGVVTNVTDFGAFVDVGVHQDGLVHISKLADRFVRRASDVVKVQQRVEVTVLEVDRQRKRIALSMRKDESATGDEAS